MAGSKGIVSNQFYTFSAANRTITFTNDYAGLDLGEITYITNIKNGVATVIYDPFDTTKGGTLSGLTLTLAYNTTAMADTDPLQVITGFTPLNADPQPVRKIDNANDVDNTALLQNISDNLDFLNLSLDQNEGIQMNVREINAPKRDEQGRLVLSSDSITTVTGTLKFNGDTWVIDATGYNSIVFTMPPLSGLGNQYFIEISNDNTYWFPTCVNLNQNNGSVASMTTSTVFSSTSIATMQTVFITTRYIRFRCAGFNNAHTITGILRNLPVPLLASQYGLPVTIASGNTVATNVTQINSSSPFAYGNTAALSQIGNGGGMYVSGHQPPTFNPPNAVTTLSTQVPWPLGVAGREWPYIGALAGVFRYLSLDARGNIIIGGDTAFRTPNIGGVLEQSNAGTARGIGGVFNNIQGAQSLTVTDTSQDFGDTHIMLLREILTELKILNQLHAELPQIINQANYTMSDPQEYRNDGAFDSSLQ